MKKNDEEQRLEQTSNSEFIKIDDERNSYLYTFHPILFGDVRVDSKEFIDTIPEKCEEDLFLIIKRLNNINIYAFNKLWKDYYPTNTFVLTKTYLALKKAASKFFGGDITFDKWYEYWNIYFTDDEEISYIRIQEYLKKENVKVKKLY